MNLPAASMTVSSGVSERIAAPAGPRWLILFPSTAIREFAAALLPDPRAAVCHVSSPKNRFSLSPALSRPATCTSTPATLFATSS